MTAIEVALLLIGVVFILGSFFVMEKLSPTELSRVAELSEDELRMVMDRELETAGAKISDMADQAVDLSMNQIQRRLEMDTNEKIMAISEYSDSVMEKLQKFNNEVTFLYSMLGDKHTELNESMAQLNDMILSCQAAQAQTMALQQQYQELQTRPVQTAEPTEPENGVDAPDYPGQPESVNDQPQTDPAESPEEERTVDVKEQILERYRTGEALKDIARDLGLGFGEVKLIVELYKGEVNP